MKNFLQWEVRNMGIYLNPTNESFQEAINSEIYVDKTGLIAFTNKNFSETYLCESSEKVR